MESKWIKIGENSDYPFLMLDILLPILKKHFSKVLVTGRQRIMQMCRDRYGESISLQFKMLDLKNMLGELYRSKVLFTAPGSEIVFDAYDKLPIFFLPPQNNTNFRNLSLYIHYQLTKHYLHWPEVFDFHLPESCSSDENEIKSVLNIIESFAKTQKAQAKLAERIKNFIRGKDTWPDILAEQKKAVEKFGINGAKTIVEAIKRFI